MRGLPLHGTRNLDLLLHSRPDPEPSRLFDDVGPRMEPRTGSMEYITRVHVREFFTLRERRN